MQTCLKKNIFSKSDQIHWKYCILAKIDIFVNELLCFLQNKVNRVPYDVIVKVCSDYYSTAKITASKELLFEIVKPSVRYRRKRGGDKDRDNVREMLYIFLTHMNNQIPIFVAQDLSKLPPLSINDFDVLQVNREIEELKGNMSGKQDDNRSITHEIQNIKESIKDLVEGQGQLLQMIHTARITQRPGTPCSQSTPIRTSLAPAANQSSTKQDESYIVLDVTDCGVESTISHSIHTDSEVSDQGSVQTAEEHHVSHLNLGEDMNGTWTTNMCPKKNSTSRSNAGDHAPLPLVGEGQFRNVRSANMKPPRLRKLAQPRQNQVASGLFITRMSPSTTARQMTLHIRRETGYSICPERLPTKSDKYSSWYIRSSNQCMQDLYTAALWPKDTLIKPYYS